VEGTQPNSWKRYLKIQNDHPSSVLNWSIRVDQQDEWWHITSGSPLSGTLNLGEHVGMYVEVDRTDKDAGEYWGYFVVEAQGVNYSYESQVTVVMEVGESDLNGPVLTNINTNTGTSTEQLRLTFDKYIDKNSANQGENYIITPFIPVTDVRINFEQITLTTAAHEIDVDYTIQILSVKDLRNRRSESIEGSYRFSYYCAGPEVTVNGSNSEYTWDAAYPDKKMYTDSDFRLGDIPDQFIGCALLRTSKTDAANEKLHLSFAIQCESAKILLGYDPRRSSSWNNDWLDAHFTKLPLTIPVSGIPDIDHFDLYESKTIFQENVVAHLYQNGAPASDYLMYVVLVNNSEAPSFHINIPDVKARASDSTITIPVIVEEDLTDWDITSYSGEINWDPTVLQHPQISRVGTLSEPWGENGFYQNSDGAGSLVFTQSVIEPSLEGTGTLFNLIFDVLGDAGDSATVNIIQFSLDSLACFIDNGTVKINNPPVVENVSINPQNPFEADSLFVTYNYNDLENDVETGTEIFWFRNGKQQTEFNNMRVLSASATSAWEQWSAAVIPNDGFDVGEESISETVYILKEFAVNNHPDSVFTSTVQNFQNKFAIDAIYPNPFNANTLIKYHLIEDAEVMIFIYNVQAQLICELARGWVSKGIYQLQWNGRDGNGFPMGSGVYFCKFRAVNRQHEIFWDQRKIILIK